MVELEPKSKLEELKLYLKEYNPVVCLESDFEDYEEVWDRGTCYQEGIDPDPTHIQILNSNLDILDISLELYRFRIEFDHYYTEYPPEQEGYNDLLKDLCLILDNELCSIIIRTFDHEFIFNTLTSEQISLETLVEFCLRGADSMYNDISIDDLMASGAVVEYHFWNPANNRIMEILAEIFRSIPQKTINKLLKTRDWGLPF